jgi:hypothetical protein
MTTVTRTTKTNYRMHMFRMLRPGYFNVKTQCKILPCFGRHVKSLVPAVFAGASTHQPALGLRGGFWPVLLMCNP